MMVSGTEVPSTAMAFFIPCLRRFKTSALPSTTMIESEKGTCGPAGNFSGPYSMSSFALTAFLTSSVSSWLSGISSSMSVSSISLALSMMYFLFVALTSSILITLTLASHGPTLSIVSRAAAKIAVSTLSRLEGTVIVP